MGYGAMVFEALPLPGGMLTVGIPAYRLPRDIVAREIEYIRKAGVELRLNSLVGADGLSLASLRDVYQAIFVAVGAHKNVPLNLPGEDLVGVLSGTELLKDVNLGRTVKTGKKVAIVGGGNVAVDAARVAKRADALEVTILYRRSRDEMPAYKEEVEAAEKEGIPIEFLAMPAKIIGSNGRVTGLECLRTVLGTPDESGRRRPEAIAGSAFVLPVDTVISAIGEVPDLAFLGDSFTKDATVKVDPRSCSTGMPGLFAGGDAVTGPATVIEAIAAGRKAAESIGRFLRGASIDEEPAPRVIGIDAVDLPRFKKHERQSMDETSPVDRVRDFREVELGLHTFVVAPSLQDASLQDASLALSLSSTYS